MAWTDPYMSSNPLLAFLSTVLLNQIFCSIKEENLLSICRRKLLRINYYFSSGDNKARPLIAGTEKNVTESRENCIINNFKIQISCKRRQTLSFSVADKV
jgi:hypothetical protein